MTSIELVRLARALTLVAGDLEHRRYAAAGVVWRGASVLTELAAFVPEHSGGCPVCGGEVVQPATGRRRKYCSPVCKRHAERGRNAA